VVQHALILVLSPLWLLTVATIAFSWVHVFSPDEKRRGRAIHVVRLLLRSRDHEIAAGKPPVTDPEPEVEAPKEPQA